MTPTFFTQDNGDRIAYRFHAGKAPTVVFLGGFRSDMTGDKASFLDRHCREKGWSYLRFDYHAHGASPGNFAEGTIGRWVQNTIQLIEAVVPEGPLILVGSSMGGWIMLHAALHFGERIAGLIGIAAAPDFTEDLMLPALPPFLQEILFRVGRLETPSEYGAYVLTREFITEARDRLLLRGEKLPISCPVRLLHGMRDVIVPWQRAQLLAEKIASDDVQVEYFPEGDHRLSAPAQLERLGDVLDGLVALAPA